MLLRNFSPGYPLFLYLMFALLGYIRISIRVFISPGFVPGFVPGFLTCLSEILLIALLYLYFVMYS